MARTRAALDFDTIRAIRAHQREALRGLVDVIEPPWLDMAKECQGLALEPYESDFISNMILWTGSGRSPSPKQARWLRSIYARMGTNNYDY
jgi:hypothetical protein